MFFSGDHVFGPGQPEIIWLFISVWTANKLIKHRQISNQSKQKPPPAQPISPTLHLSHVVFHPLVFA